MVVAKRVPRVLLLDVGGVTRDMMGGILFREVCRMYPKGRMSWFSLVAPGSHTQSESSGLLSAEYNEVPFETATKPRESFPSVPARFLDRLPTLRYLVTFLTLLCNLYARAFCVPRLMKRAVEFGTKQNAETVVAALNGPIVIFLAREVASRLGVPLVTVVMDPPESIAENCRVDGFTRRAMVNHCAAALRASVRRGTASEGMRDAYRRELDVDSVVMIHGFAKQYWKTRAKYSVGKDFRIVFAGSLYAVKEWAALLEALSSVAWRVADREVTIRVLSQECSLQARGPLRVEFLGWRSQEETLRLLAEADLAYLPYWFDESRSRAVRTCFPNKLSAYVAAGLPIFYHGPEYASVAGFLKRYGAGYLCHSLETSDILQGLRKVAGDGDFYRSIAEGARRALVDELNADVFRARVAALLDVDPEVLAGA